MSQPRTDRDRVILSHLVFDLDNTLYAPTCGVVERVHDAITAFMVERLDMTAADADALRARYREELGTTLNGLMRHHAVAPDEYLEYVHAIDVETLLARDAALRTMLDALPHAKIVFTNGSANHAERVLACLGVRECFEEIYSLERVDYVPKPEPAAFASLLRALDVAAPRCLVIDDRADNLRTAAALGMRTVLVGGDVAPDGVDAVVPSILELPATLRAIEAS
jgi:putative hydrolase of the HAD superfamily